MKKIKWENIILLVLIPFGLISMINHLLINGFYLLFLAEPFIYIGIPIILSLVIEFIRKEL